jgi:hypothetical protein
VALWDDPAGCGEYRGLRFLTICLLERVGLRRVEAVAGVPVLLDGPHGDTAPALQCRDPARYNPAAVRWARETLIPLGEAPFVRRGMEGFYAGGLQETARALHATRLALDENPELPRRLVADYLEQPEPDPWLLERLVPLAERVSERTGVDHWLAPVGGGF